MQNALRKSFLAQRFEYLYTQRKVKKNVFTKRVRYSALGLWDESRLCEGCMWPLELSTYHMSSQKSMVRDVYFEWYLHKKAPHCILTTRPMLFQELEPSYKLLFFRLILTKNTPGKKMKLWIGYYNYSFLMFKTLSQITTKMILIKFCVLTYIYI